MVFFTPCLLFANIASVVSLERLISLWPIPAFYLTFIFICWVICRAVSPLFNVDPYQRRFVLACSMFNNANSLPVAIMAGLAVSEAGKSLYRQSSDTQAIIAARGISYVLFFGLFSNFVRWSYGFSLLQRRSKLQEHTLDESTSILPITSQDESSKYGSTQSLLAGRRTYAVWCRTLENIQGYMSPPLYAAILALLVGLCSPIKDLMYNKNAFLYASFTRAIESCGKASVPVVLVCLGAQLRMIRKTQEKASDEIRKIVRVTLLVRIVLVPLCIIPIVYLFAKLGQDSLDLAKDPVFIVAMVIVGCMPTSINLAQISQANRAFKDEMLHVLFWTYGVACIPLCTLVVFSALYIVHV
ncbi:membrane transport protein-domain-containing protein [Sporodiniella umbellata]|nr:membrane transport protein-domain-containing protein [Sporodiniella umbellata]